MVEQKNTILASGNGRAKMMEREVDSWTVECLRGRLLAERVASRTARKEAELIGKKLIQLESQLRAEIESRNKVEKRLKFLIEKMKSLNLSNTIDNSSSSSPSTASTDLNLQEEQNPTVGSACSCDTKDGRSPGRHSSSLEKDYVGDDRLALVPASETSETEMHNHDIHDVLAVLRRAREQLEKSMGEKKRSCCVSPN